MAIIGSIDHYITSSIFSVNFGDYITVTGSTYANNMFVVAYNFLNNNTGTLGIERIAYNFGDNGTGMNFYGESDACGENVWACFRFASADVPFYVLIQSTMQHNLGTNSGNTAQNGLVTKYWYQPLPDTFAYEIFKSIFCYQFAQRGDGGNCWNGTTNNDGTDTKGDPVWISGSSGLGVYPLVNNFITGVITGTLSKNYMRSFFNIKTDSSDDPYLSVFLGSHITFNLLADENNFLMFGNYASFKNKIHYFGKLNILTQSYSNVYMECPYFYLSNYHDDILIKNSLLDYFDINNLITNNSLKTQGTIYGSLNGIDNQDGGALAHSSFNGAYGIYFDMPSRHRSNSFYLNYNFNPPRLDTIPLDVWIDNGGTYAGKTNNFLRLVGGNSDRYDVTDDMQYTIIDDNQYGGVSINNIVYQNLLVPWGGGILPGTSTSRSGVQF